MVRGISWDTSSSSGAIAAFTFNATEAGDHPKILSSWRLDVRARSHAEQLLWAIHQVLGSCGWTLDDLDLIGVGIGPGSFTGLRIGITTAKALSFARPRIALVGFSSLAALMRPIAHNLAAAKANPNTLLCSVTDAAKGELFYSIDTLAGALASDPSKKDTEAVSSPQNVLLTLSERLKSAPTDTTLYAVGVGTQLYASSLWGPLSDRVSIADDAYFTVCPEATAELATEKWRQGLFQSPMSLVPRYLRASSAEVLRQKRESEKQP